MIETELLIYIIFTAYIALGICAGFVYERKKRYVLWGAAGSCGVYAGLVFTGVSFVQLEGLLTNLSNWASKMGTGGLGLPIGMIVGQDFAKRLG